MMVNGEDVSVANKAESADKAYSNVLAYAGAGINANSRPKIDKQVMNEAKTGTGNFVGARPYSEANESQKATIDKMKIQCGVTFNYPKAITKVATVDYGSYYRIKNVNSGKYLNVFNSSSGTKLTQTSNLSDNSIWQVAISKDGYIKLANQSSSSNMMVIDVPAASKENGVQLQIWGNSVGDHQELKLKDNSDGTFGILTKISGDTKALDVYGYSKDEGANVQQWTSNNNNCQRWRFERVG